ncbi:hypothetical protein LTR20_008130 [Exophiala xenobiotica]|nr:hypothetical protein LTR40_007720 [Exophiala xenobiotica]KAK5384041.1 hypothetical protein LTS13_002234 [Exophiala xenobiotica]KAK5399639.1 hypothetical protein LTR79_003276 [Exophiala xenobiotica]KAK5416274.1 hypothetical protein LTR90_005495 [Exophiala xenobiotica]KAK5458643.1 hypothetical protein LTR20_008130 [Exophiala xenobiotica]
MTRQSCALPTRYCNEGLRNYERVEMHTDCPKHVRLKGRSSSRQYENVHPALRYASSSQHDSPRYQTSASIRNPARDLYDMPAINYNRRESDGSPKFYSSLRNVRDNPHIPVLSPSYSSGIRKNSTRDSPRTGRSRTTPRSGRNYSQPTSSSYNYSESQRATVLQRQADVRRAREVRERCEGWLQSGDYTPAEIQHHPMFQELSERDQWSLLYDYEQASQDREGRKHARSEKRSRCIVM